MISILLQEKIQIGGVEDMEFLRVLKKEHGQTPWSSKKEVDFPRVIKKKSCGFSIGFGFWSWNFQRMQHNSVEFPGMKSCFLKVKWEIYKVQGAFSEKYAYGQPTTSLDFFWNSLILVKGGRECINQPTKIRLRYLAWFSPDVLYTIIAQDC